MKRNLLSLLVGLSFIAVAPPAVAAGTVSVTRVSYDYGKSAARKAEIVTVSWTADASDASVPATTLTLSGFLLKAITKPGTTAPTSGYGITVNDPLDSTHDALNSALTNRSSSATETVQPYLASTTAPIFLAGTYTLKWASNIVHSSSGKLVFYFVD